ncbi:hypothetical protein ABVF61_31520 [Roseibium sp. HPY-6]|uniref:hypothetical protein n=1 Tax=Roseibium sp. HPY-6 TaxID=3229852 RepID=UPI00338EFEDA
MKKLIDRVFLLNRTTGQYEGAELFHGFDMSNLSHIEGRWRPMFEVRRNEAKETRQTLASINAEDAHWDWGKKALAAINDPFLFDFFVLECGGNTQAIMMTRKGGVDCFSRHVEHERKPLIYVEFLATAPWNRPGFVAEPTYKGSGRVLIATAVSLSLEEEMGGRVGLHSLPAAEQFYRDAIGMSDLGLDEEGVHEGLRYFELPASQAAIFLSVQH